MVLIKKSFFLYFFYLLCFLVSIYQTLHFSLNPDSSWLITAAEKMLSGEILGVDILESNPPASILIYVPGILFARLFSLPSEIGVSISIYLLTLFVCFFFQYISRKTNIIGFLPTAIVCLFLVFITFVYFQLFFSQREHFAVLLAIPYILISSVRLSERKQSLSSGIYIISGCCMGLTGCIKPVFLLVPLFLTLSCLFSTRNWRSLFVIENLSAGFIFLLYVAGVLIFFNAYLTFLEELLVSAYFSRVQNWSRVFFSEGFLYIIMAVLYVIMSLFFKQSILQKQFFIASIAFYLTFLIQRKGFFYQVYPALVTLYLATLLLCVQVVQKKILSLHSVIIKIPVLIIILYTMSATASGIFSQWNVVTRPTQLEAYIFKNFSHPKMLSLAGKIGAGFPLARNVSAQWVGSVHSIFTAPHLSLDKQRYLLAGGYDADFLVPEKWLIKRVCKDIYEKEPTLIVLEHLPKWSAFIFSQPCVQDVMSNYHLTTTLDQTDLWVKKENIPIFDKTEHPL